MLAFRSVVSVLLRALGAFSLHPQGRTRAGSDATVTGEPASPSRQMIPNAIRHLPAHATAGLATTVGFLMSLFMLATAANVVGPVLGGRRSPG